MEVAEIRQKISENQEKLVKLLGGLFDLDRLEEDIALLENRMTEPDFWNDNIAAQKTSQELNELKMKYETFNNMKELF